jgi:predicted metal-dependent phosphoesterase TrpH
MPFLIFSCFSGFMKRAVAVILVVGLTLTVSMNSAVAASTPAADFEASFKAFTEQTEQALKQSIKDIQSALKDLPDDLEEAMAETDAARRRAILNDLRRTQAQLEAAAKAYEQEAQEYEAFAEKAAAYDQEALAQAKASRAKMQASYQEKIKDIKDSFALTSDAINTLAADTQKATEDAGSFLRDRLDEHLKALDDALKSSDDALKTLFK